MTNLQIAIIGNGPAGYTAALYAARAGLKPVVFSGDMPGGLLMQASRIENFPGFTGAVSGPQLMAALEEQATHFGAVTEYDTVKAVRFAPGRNTLSMASGKDVAAQAVIVATGTRHRSLGLPREKDFLGHGVSFCAVCDAAFYRGRVVAIAGGSERAAEEAMVLAAHAETVHLLHRRSQLNVTPGVLEQLQKTPNIVVHLECMPVALLGADRLTGVQVRDLATGEVSELPCEGLFAAIGVQPNTDFLEGSGIGLDDTGYIIRSDSARSTTNLPGVFAAGDCAEPYYHQAVIAAGAGARAAMDAIRYLREKG